MGLQLVLYTTPVARETVYFTPWAYSSCYVPHLWPGRRYISPRGPTARVMYHTCGQGDGIFRPVGLQLVLYTTPVARETVYFTPWAYSSCYIPHLWPGRRYISPRGPTARVIYHTCGQGDGIFHPVGLQLVLYTTPVARETVYFAPWAYSSWYIPHLWPGRRYIYAYSSSLSSLVFCLKKTTSQKKLFVNTVA